MLGTTPWGAVVAGPGGLMSQVSFAASLVSSLVVDASTGSGTPTFTRADATPCASHTDFEGIVRVVPANAARFQGNRLVYNQCPTPSNTLASGSNKNLTVTAGTWMVSMGAGTGVLTFSGTAGATGTLTADASKRTVKVFSGLSAGTLIATASVATVVDIQYENATGRTDVVNPSEYVSVGVLSSPYQGAGVDGLLYTPYLNGNTVASNVVTAGTGAWIKQGVAGVSASAPVDAAGPLGYLAEGSRTNAGLQSESLATTWTVSSGTDMNAVTDNFYIAPSGATTMSKALSPKATNSTHYLSQAFTWTAAIYTVSAYIRYVNKQWVSIVTNDGTTTRGASFDVLNGVAGALTASATSTIKPTGLAGVYRVTMTHGANTAAAAGTVRISLNNTDTATLESWNAAGTELAGVWGVQWEIGAFASSYIPTVASAVTRAADDLSYPVAGNVNTSASSFYLEYVPSTLANTNGTLLEGTGGITGLTIAVGSSGTAFRTIVRNGANRGDFGGPTALVVGSLFKNSVSLGSSPAAAINGTLQTLNSTPAQSDWGASFSLVRMIGTSHPYGTIRNVRIWPTALTAAQLQAITLP